MRSRLVGVIGKTNVGKSTFFSAATLISVEIGNRPFKTIKPNVGVGYVRVKCVCGELGVKDNPRNSLCVKGFRFIPVKLMDVAGLIRDAHRGRGLGNRFLDDLRQADALIHVVDAAGSTDEEGQPVPPGTHDPLEDVLLIEKEVDLWLFGILKKDWEKFARTVDYTSEDPVQALARRLSGLSVTRRQVAEAMREAKLESAKLSSWRDEELLDFVRALRRISKPTIIAANKADLPEAEDNIKRMQRELKDRVIVPTSAVAELALRKAAKQGLIEYLPGDSSFKILDESKMTSSQLKALEYIEERVLKKWGSTGVQEAINRAFFNLLDMIVVYPVEDASKLTDHEGRVLPDAFLVPRGTTARQFAYLIHTDLGESFLYAVRVRDKQKVGEDYVLQDGDIIKIVAVKARRA
ncbi:MAG: redox-regulated ATPase YchF [Thermoprotei archaeon]|nr:MAG: redox-regulated ATPase YchF [Thermoprotei archaeon]